MKRVLIISYYWPPSGGSGVQRWVKFSKYLPENGWQPVIYTPSNPQRLALDRSLEKEIPHCVEVITRPIWEPYSIYRKLVRKKGGNVPDINPINNNGDKSLSEQLSLWIRANLFIPDPRVMWKRSSVKFLLDYLRKHPVDAIRSTGPPQSMHLIARDLHLKTGIKWLADFRDPWTDFFCFKYLPVTKFAMRKHLKLEKSVALNANRIIQVSPNGVSVFKNKYPEANVVYISNGYDDEDYLETQNIPDNKFSFLHAGFFPKEANPDSLWQVFSELCQENENFCKDLCIKLVGNVDYEVIDSISNYGLTEQLETTGYIPHDQIPQIQTSSWGLILPLRKEAEAEGIITGKFFEYLAAKRPIVAFGSPDGDLSLIIKETQSGKIFNWDDTTSLKEHILSLYNLYKKGEFCPPSNNDVTTYSRREKTKILAQLLTTINNED